jgi:antitoxin PrlF
MLSSALTTKGQVTIPNQIRQRLKLRPGDKVGFAIEDDHVVLFRKINDVRAAFGLYQAKHGVSLEEMEQAIRRRGKHDRD